MQGTKEISVRKYTPAVVVVVFFFLLSLHCSLKATGLLRQMCQERLQDDTISILFLTVANSHLVSVFVPSKGIFLGFRDET